jgi:hypothetical protein
MFSTIFSTGCKTCGNWKTPALERIERSGKELWQIVCNEQDGGCGRKGAACEHRADSFDAWNRGESDETVVHGGVLGEPG